MFFGLSLWPQKIWKFILDPTAIDKSYGRNSQGLYTLGRFTKSGTYGYVILADARSADLSTARSIFESFKTHVPFYANWENKLLFEGISMWLGAVGVALFLTALYFVLGKSGQLIRQGVELNRNIEKAKIELEQKYELIDYEKYGRYNRKAMLLIVGPVLGRCVIYSVIAAEFPVTFFLISFFC